jgi:hypothetical protein
MASIIRIKRSEVAGNPTTLAAGELAYSALPDNGSNGGDRLYIGSGVETSGDAANHFVIGGRYFTEKLDHTPGVLNANSAIITDSNNKIDILNVDDITINGSTISSSGNTSIILDPSNGFIDISGSILSNVATPVSGTDAANKQYVDDEIDALGAFANLDISGDSGTDSIVLQNEVLNFAGGTGISTVVSNNNLEIILDNTGVVANTYGSSASIPVITVNAQGQITSANTVNISTDLSIAGDTGTDAVSLLNDTLTFVGGTGLTSLVSNNQVEFFLDNTAVAAGSFGNVDTVATFTVDQQGRITAASDATILITSTQVSDFTEAVQDAVGFSFIEGDATSGITVTYTDSANSLIISAEDATTASKGVASFNADDFDVTTGVVSLEDTVVKSITTDDGNLTPSGHGISILGGEGIDVNHLGTAITINGEDATSTNKGIASFNATNFTVTSGAVAANDFTIGDTSLTIGESTTFLSGLTSIEIDNIRIDGNTISSTNANGNIVLDPEGSGSVDVNNSRITNVSDPINDNDAANKKYVDDVAQGLSILPEAKAATDADLGATYTDGPDPLNPGVGATLTIPAVATLNIDDVTDWVLNDNILVKNQTNAAENGSYAITQLGDAVTPWILTRNEFDDEPFEMAGSFEFVTSGTLYGSTGWVATVPSAANGWLVGEEDIVWVQFSGAGTYLAGDGLSITGNEFSVNVDNSSIEISTDVLRVKAGGITNTMLAGSIENNKLVNSTITFAAETGTADPVSLGETITFAAGEGINTTVTNNTITIEGEDASDTNKGIASFSATDFIVSSGAVSINVEKIQDEVAAFVNSGTAITITYDDSANTLTFDSDIATTTTLGVASFSSTNFAVSLAGEVTVTAIDGGTY